jgi:transcription-repair coupling factor (superfamily II helicase)
VDVFTPHRFIAHPAQSLALALEGLRDFERDRHHRAATSPRHQTFVRRVEWRNHPRSDFASWKRGQVYFLHNEVDTIENRRMKLVFSSVVPEARIAIAHGNKMPERELVRCAILWPKQRHNVLLCSTTIERPVSSCAPPPHHRHGACRRVWF